MRYRVEVTETFMREFKRLSKRYPSLLEDVKSLRQEILANPKLGVDLGGGLRKIRMSISSKGRGKSGGGRVITFNVVVSVDETEINLLFLYDKAEQSTILKKDISVLLRKNGFDL